MQEGRGVATSIDNAPEVLCGATWDGIAQARETLDESILHLIDDEFEMAIEIAWDDCSYELEPRGAVKEKPPDWWPPSEWASQDAPITLCYWLDRHGGPNHADWVDQPDEIKSLDTRSQTMVGTNLIEFDEQRIPEIRVPLMAPLARRGKRSATPPRLVSARKVKRLSKILSDYFRSDGGDLGG
jgi:hypothetical protein